MLASSSGKASRHAIGALTKRELQLDLWQTVGRSGGVLRLGVWPSSAALPVGKNVQELSIILPGLSGDRLARSVLASSRRKGLIASLRVKCPARLRSAPQHLPVAVARSRRFFQATCSRAYVSRISSMTLGKPSVRGDVSSGKIRSAWIGFVDYRNDLIGLPSLPKKRNGNYA
jgi:hypothetical protein